MPHCRNRRQLAAGNHAESGRRRCCVGHEKIPWASRLASSHVEELIRIQQHHAERGQGLLAGVADRQAASVGLD